MVFVNRFAPVARSSYFIHRRFIIKSVCHPHDMRIPLTALIEGCTRWVPDEGEEVTGIPGLSFYRSLRPTVPHAGMYEANLSIVVQGRKQVVLGQEPYEYDASHFLINSLELPVVARVIEASPEQPYLSLLLNIDLVVVRQLMVDMNLPLALTHSPAKAIGLGATFFELLDAVLRLARLIDRPDDIPVLSGQIQREILYRLLISEQGPRLRQMAFADSHGFQIGQSIAWLKQHFREPFRIEQLASAAGMAVSTLHHHFRATVGMTPLQYQKHLRLQEARRLMLIEGADAGTAAIHVGYESQSQFTREYRRMFGNSPMQDIKSLRR
ncbi:AraC family transcriptional regulator [Dickeya fangzhongdai]|uniref:AraC family transcriptional regulator n=1 Tax=Dickeya fangzhongdai TaxID=1778540 RepID=UPI001AD9D6DB|nr:AraC family transcriptional regulator [Dickeya fangzhongdai]